VVALQDHRAQQEHRCGCVRGQRPGRQGGFGATEEARVTELSRLIDVQARHLLGEPDVAAVLSQDRIHVPQRSAGRVACARQPLEHEAVVGGNERRRLCDCCGQ